MPGAREAMKYLKETGWKIVIWTARHDLDHVRDILMHEGVPFDHINEEPETDANNYSRKIRADVFVDDKSFQFDGDWAKAISELDRRRSMWKLDGETKAEVKVLYADREGKVKSLAVFGVEGGRVVEKSGTQNPFVKDMIETGVEEDGKFVRPDAGIRFLKALMGLQGTYLWAEVA